MDANKIHEILAEKVSAGDVRGAVETAGQAVQYYLDKIGGAPNPLPGSNAVFAYVAMRMHVDQLECLLNSNDKKLAELLLSACETNVYTVEICPDGKEGHK